MIYLQSSYVQSPDSGTGGISRPGIMSLSGERIASLETLFSFFINAVKDPDKALAQDPLFLEKLMRHPQVSACMNIREQKVASMLWRVDAAEECDNQEAAEAARKYVAKIWAAIANKDALLQQMQIAVLHGGIGHEWIWTKHPDGTQRPMRFYPVHKSRFDFDLKGNMALKTRPNPVWGALVGSNPTNPQQPQTMLPMGKFTYHIYEQAPGAWNRPADEGYVYYGRGEDEDLYDLVIRDTARWLLQMKWLQQYGNPPRILYYPESGQFSGYVSQIIEALLTRPVVAVPDSMGGDKRLFELVMPDVPSPSFDAFGHAKSEHYDAIEAILLGSVGVLSQQDNGGYAAHKSRQDAGPDMLARRDATRICSTLNSQLVPAILKYGPPELANLPAEYMPQIVLYNEDGIDAATLESATKLVAVPSAFIYKSLRIPMPKDDEETVFQGSQPDPFAQLEDLKAGADPAAAQGDEPKAAIGDDEVGGGDEGGEQ